MRRRARRTVGNIGMLPVCPLEMFSAICDSADCDGVEAAGFEPAGGWNTGMLPVRPVEMFSAVLETAGFKPVARTDCKSMFLIRRGFRLNSANKQRKRLTAVCDAGSSSISSIAEILP